MERSEHHVRGTSRRKRRRRSKVKGTSTLEVKENHKIQVDCDLLPKHHPATFCTTRHGSRAVKARQLLEDGKDRLLYQSKTAVWTVTQKNPVVQLNELRPGLRYEITTKAGPLHAPVFSVTVDVDGLHFEGRGPTKKWAKIKAAELALRSFVQFPNASQIHAVMGNFTSTSMDFTADKLDVSDVFLKDSEPEICHLVHCNTSFSSLYNHKRLVHLALDLVTSANPKCQALGTSFLEHRSSVVLLNQLRPGLRYTCLAERVRGRLKRSFVMVVVVEGRVFEGCGRSKKLAKARAAGAALQSLCNISLGPERKVMRLQGSRDKNQLPQFFAESIFHLVREKYAELTAATSHAHRHKVLAGIVMTRGFDLRSAQVVSLATGTKCRDLDVTSDCNWTLNDCHAEVLSRRALLRFLYAQLELLLCESADHEERSVFVRGGGGGGLRLRDSVLFHMYVGSSPCGDARLNCPYESTAAYSSRRFQCHLRVKVNSGEGTLPITPRRAANQPQDSASAGKPPVTMSCTDKMAKWSVVGLQGALLSHLVEPVYLHSLTVGTLSHTGHLSRALTRRLAGVKRLPFPYRRQRLLLSGLSSSDVRPAGKPPNISVNWSCGDEVLEEISTSTGRRRNCGTASQLCKNSLFTHWQRLQRLQQQQQISGADVTTETYCGSKLTAGPYQRALQLFTAALQAGGLGAWLRKSP
ncbi:double-stranded RNA-specific editase B2-like isoform X1 [Solea solea]|uniref:double-stranded RNA-specific editase B2-like isoform X1 n=1 Tax=Solea solea TaxID=90069 RepID=UPI00272D383A|nr:double-stranded RNA-specific editase B2-like isoform X1 [Solea solea]XP_058478316.1 double-stranded RNA-specific editase B2-like isoform X1 [Solea solea]XP_058478325.1 double-stranded RNA-specific editase B2-like isoform X1 [Solea solea]